MNTTKNRTAKVMWQATTGRNVAVCDRHSNKRDVQRVAGPYKVWEDAALVGPGHRDCDVCSA